MSADARTLSEVVRDALASLSVDAGLDLQTGAVVAALEKRLHRADGQDICIPHLIMERGELRFLTCSVTGAVDRRIADVSAAEPELEMELPWMWEHVDFKGGADEQRGPLFPEVGR